MRDIKIKKDVPLWKGRSNEHDYGKDYNGKFPFDIERLPNESDDHYAGYCKGMESMFDLVKKGDLADMGVTYNENFDEDYDECDCCNCFDEAFDLGFKKGHQVACEECMDDIYISGSKIDKIDDIRQKVIALGHISPFECQEQIDAILKDLSDLMKGLAFDAIEEYLGYR